jgi:hypothetical protein
MFQLAQASHSPCGFFNATKMNAPTAEKKAVKKHIESTLPAQLALTGAVSLAVTEGPFRDLSR